MTIMENQIDTMDKLSRKLAYGQAMSLCLEMKFFTAQTIDNKGEA